MSKRWFLISLGLFFFLQFIFFSYLVHKNLFTQLDFNNTVHLQDHMPRRFDALFSIFSDIGDAEVMTIILVVLFLVIRKWRAAFVAAGFFIAFHLIEIYGKVFVHHRPPPEFMLRTIRAISLPQFTIREQNSYPSGHSGRTMFVSTLLIVLILSSKRLSPLMKFIFIVLILGFDVTMLVSRVYLGEHWTSDVIGGSMLGLALGCFSAVLLVTKDHGKAKPFFPKYKVKIERVES